MMMNRTISLFATVFLLFAAAPALSLAQNADPIPVVAGEQVTIYSEILGEDRPVWIHKPVVYDQTSTAYPVLYLLDGDAHFLHTAGIIQFLSSIGDIYPMLERNWMMPAVCRKWVSPSSR